MEMKSFSKKAITCSVAALSLNALLLNVFNTGANIPWYPAMLSFYISALLFLSAVIWAIIWHYKESKEIINSQNHFEVFYTIIRYSIAFNVSSFGWAKLLEVQFRVPESISSQPMNQQSGEWLTWYYFGYSHSFTSILALAQIVGSTLLLFRKTVLLGAVLLFALMSNITLINIFYRMNFGALLISILVTIGITYLILLDYKRLVEFFFKSNSPLPPLSGGIQIIRNIFLFSAIVLSLLFVLYLKSILK
jgi:hypothetical protein